MRRFLATFSVWSLLLVLLTFTAASGGERPKIIVGGDHANPPYEFIENGQPTGFNVDLMRAVANAVGADVEFRLGPWNKVRQELEQGKIDALAGMYYSEERSKAVDFSVPHTMVTAGLFVRNGSLIRSIDDMKGKEVIVQKGDVIDDYLRKEGTASRIIEVKDPADVLRLLASESHDCALMPSRFQGEYLIRSLRISNVRGMSANLPQFRYCFTVKRGNSSLKYRLDEGLNILKVNGKYKEIYNKWFGVYEQRKLWRTVRYFVWALGLIAGLLAASSVWSWMLRREVRKRTAELRESEGRLRTLVHTLPDLVWLKDRNGVFLSCNSMFERLYNAPEAAIVGKTDYDFVDRELADFFIMNDRKAIAAGMPTSNEEWLTFADDGHRALVETIKTPVYDDTGGLIGVLGIGRDVTHRKQAEEALRESEEKFRVLAETSPAAICVYQEENHVYVNAAMIRLTGYSEQELMGMRFWGWMHPDSKELVRERGIARQRGEQVPSRYEIKCLSKNGEEKWIIVSAGRIEYKGTPAGIVTLFDITDRKRMEDELQHAHDDLEIQVEERTAELCRANESLEEEISERKRTEDTLLLSQFCIDRAAIGIFQISLDTGQILRFNDAACRSIGCSAAELGAMTIFDVDPSLTRQRYDELQSMVDESGSFTFETVHRGKNGTTFPVEVTTNNLEFQDKKYGFAFFKDISERREAEEALKRAKEEWERTFASVPDLIAILDEQHRVVRVNKAMAKRLGLKPDECVGLHCYEAIHGLSEAPPFCPHMQTLMDGRKHVVEVHEERLGGDFLVSTIPLNDERGVMIGSVHIAYDITERKRAEEALRESESRVKRKLESILDPEGDIGELDLADIIDAPGIQALMDDLYRNMGLKMSIIDLKGRVLVDVGWQDICLKFHRAHPETLKNCHESDTDLTVGVPPGEFRTYKCKNNMWHLVTPIIVGGRHMGNLFMGQFFFDNEELDYDLFRAQARQYGFPEEEYIAALEAVPRRSEERVNKGKTFFLRLIDMFSKLSYGNIKLARSLSERDRLTETLRESEAQLKIAMEIAKLGAWEYDVDTGMFSFDDQFYALYGTTAEREGGPLMSAEVYARNFIPPEESAVVANGIEEVRVNSHFQLEHRIIRADGEERFIVVRGEAIFDQEGRFVKIRGANQDITERKRAEEELRKANMVVENSPVVLFRCKAAPGWPVELVSKNVIQFGYAPEEFLSGELTYSSIVYPRDLGKLTAETEEYSATGKGKWLQEYRIVTKEGDLRWIIDETVCERNEEKEITHYEGVIIDVTERRKAEEQLILQQMQLRDLNRTLEERVREEVKKNREKDIVLIQQNRQAALGEMFDHIAHQWKQPLNSIAVIIQALGSTSAYEQVTTKDILETVDSIMDMVGHMAETVEVFRNFYRPDKGKSVFLVKDSIDKALTFVTPVFRRYGIEVDLDADLELSAFGYPKEYAQVLLNLLANAKDAFIERRIKDPRINIKAFADGEYAVVTIADNAGGVPDTNIEHIFDLYFTTKESSGGTGIGLYMSKNIIDKNMGGKLTVSNVDNGAQFRIELGKSCYRKATTSPTPQPPPVEGGREEAVRK
jgi:PAS domain S-box-containing protein